MKKMVVVDYMRRLIIEKLKNNKKILRFVYNSLRVTLNAADAIIPKKDKILFSSFGGRKFDDSPLALYEKLSTDERFEKYEMIWAFVSPDKHIIPRGRKVKIDTIHFFYELLSSKIWISNAGIDRGIELSRKRHISVETWHGTPLKKIGDDSNDRNALNENKLRKIDNRTIRCAQSYYDLEIFSRVFNADKKSFLLCDLPRNDSLLSFSEKEKQEIRRNLGVPSEKKLILYMPTYREYLRNDKEEYYIAPPINIRKWESLLSNEYVLLVRAHYTINKLLHIQDSDFIKDVSNYSPLNELYAVSDIMISDYSSAFVDFSILDKPMLCFPYDYETYNEKRGMYIDLLNEFPGNISFDEDSLLQELLTMDTKEASDATRAFHKKYAPYAGNACTVVIERIIERQNKGRDGCNKETR